MSAPTPIDPVALRAEIEQVRTDLGETIAALAAKTDVKARAKDAISEARYGLKRRLRLGVTSVRESLDEAGMPMRPMPVAIGAAFGALVGLVIFLAIRRRP